jgi:hypothetical protein
MSDLCTKRLCLTRRSLLALFAAFTGGVMILLAAPAAAGPIVDPSTPPPPPPNAVCREAGGQVICDTFLVEEVVNEPITDFDLPCGTIYETSLRGFKMPVHAEARWYSWMSPPRRSRRPISPAMCGVAPLADSGGRSASARCGRSRL